MFCLDLKCQTLLLNPVKPCPALLCPACPALPYLTMPGQSQTPVFWPMLRADSPECQAVLEVQMGPAAGVCTSRNAADATLSARQAGPHVLSGPRP